MVAVNYELVVWKRYPPSPASCPRNRRRVQYCRVHYARIKTNPSRRRVVGAAGEGTALWGCI